MSALQVKATITPIEIGCPEWCVETAEHHAHELSELGGTLIHAVRENIEDPTGSERVVVNATAELGLDNRRCAPFPISMHAVTDLDGYEVESPTMFLGDLETTLEQAERVAEMISLTIEAYVAAGGLLRRTWSATHPRPKTCPGWCEGHPAQTSPGDRGIAVMLGGWDGDTRAHSRATGELDDIDVRAVQVEQRDSDMEPAIVELTIQSPRQAELTAFEARILAGDLIRAAEMVEASDHARREAQS